MYRIETKLRGLARKAITCYLTPDFPFTGITPDLVFALENSGVDLIEIGIPFSDPLADGLIIQQSSKSVLEKGINLQKIFQIISEIRAKSDIPIIIMGYANSVLNEGIDNFFKKMNDGNADGVIIADVPLEEMHRFLPACHKYKIDYIPLISPLTPTSRVVEYQKAGSGFIYAISLPGVTGIRDNNFLNSETVRFLNNAREVCRLPLLVGFGISKKEQIEYLYPHCDGFIIGSALLKTISNAKNKETCIANAVHFINNLRE